jgi:transposase
VSKVKLSDIRRDGGTQPRAAINYDLIEEYKEAYQMGSALPPPVVFFDGEAYWLADGFHRHSAYYVTGLDEMECDVRQGTRLDAVWYSCSANQSHGLRRSNSDKRRAVMAALEHPKSKTLSDSAIAEHCGVSHTTVANTRKEVQPETKSEPRTGRDGRATRPSSEKRSQAKKLRTISNDDEEEIQRADVVVEETQLQRIKEALIRIVREASILDQAHRREVRDLLVELLEDFVVS